MKKLFFLFYDYIYFCILIYYEKIDYNNSHTPVIITCREHGDFLQTPDSHLNKFSGCSYCAKNIRQTTEEFIEKAKIIHLSLYDYSDSFYQDMHSRIRIICPKHGLFFQTPNSHLRGSGCSICAKNKKKTTVEFVEQATKIHGNKYCYTNVVYLNCFVDVEIICPEHGFFSQTPHNHLLGAGCSICAGNKKKNTEDFIIEAKKIHNNKYDYTEIDYLGIFIKVKIKCPKHGLFLQSPNNHLRGHNCPKCKYIAETLVGEILSLYTLVQYQYKLENKKYDFYLPEFNILIERDGEQHYKNNTPFNKTCTLVFQRVNDRYKTELALKMGYKIARLPYWLSRKHLKIEIENILKGTPSYPNIPDINQDMSKPKPKSSKCE